MPLHDYLCPSCALLLADQYRSVEEGASAHPPSCPDCGRTMDWIPAVGAIDLFSDGSGLAKFQMYDGQNRPVTVESYAQMRKLERESEQQARNGEGQPLRFRALHQSRSNMLDNTFGDGPSTKPSAAGKRKFGLRGAARQIEASPDTVPDRAYGPGVHDGNTSALDHLKSNG